MDSPSQAACSARSSLAPQGRASRRRASAARPAVRLASLTVSLRSAAVLQASKRPASKGGDNVRKPMAAAGTAVFFVLAPGVVAGLLPWWLTGWRVRQPLPWWAWAPLRVAGGAPTPPGGPVRVPAFVRFSPGGAGTPAPPPLAAGPDRPTLTPLSVSRNTRSDPLGQLPLVYASEARRNCRPAAAWSARNFRAPSVPPSFCGDPFQYRGQGTNGTSRAVTIGSSPPRANCDDPKVTSCGLSWVGLLVMAGLGPEWGPQPPGRVFVVQVEPHRGAT